MNRLSRTVFALGIASVVVAPSACSGASSHRTSGTTKAAAASGQKPAAAANEARTTGTTPPPQGPPVAQDFLQSGSSAIRDPERVYPMWLYNNTPYTWTLDTTQTYMRDKTPGGVIRAIDWHGDQPPRTVPPGGNMSVRKLNKSTEDMWVGYRFTDADGRLDLVQIHGLDTDAPATGYANTWMGDHWAATSPTFHIAPQPGTGHGNSLGAFLNESAKAANSADSAEATRDR